MIKQSPLRTDLVISMTLAEMFLLLLFVVWYSVTRSASDSRPEMWKALAEERQQKVQQLQNQLVEKDGKIAELEIKIKWWRENFNADLPQSTKDLETILKSPKGKEVLSDIGRGYPRCDNQNVLIHASVVRGTMSIELLTKSPQLIEWSAKSGVAIPPPRTILSGSDQVRSFLSTVDVFYTSRLGGSRCRFDYSLTYETKEDYYDGRETFERSFYPAGISRVRQ